MGMPIDFLRNYNFMGIIVFHTGVDITMSSYCTEIWYIIELNNMNITQTKCNDCGCIRFNNFCGNPSCDSLNIVRRIKMSPVKYANPEEPEWEEKTGRHWGCGEKQEDCECEEFQVERHSEKENDD